MWEWLGSAAGKNASSIIGAGLGAYGTYTQAENQKNQFNKMFDLEKAQLARDNKKEDDRQNIIDSVYSFKL